MSSLALLSIALLCFAAGAATGYWLRVPVRESPLPEASTPEQAPPPAAARDPEAAADAAVSSGPLPDVIVPVPDDMARRAGVQVVTVTQGQVTDRVRVPGTVTTNQYKQVVVSAVTGGRVTRVVAQLGDRVSRGAPLAELYSSDLSDAKTRYLAARADLGAADERLNRTTRLVSIGAASRQELEQMQADRTKLANEMEGAAARLRLLGLSDRGIAGLKSAKDITASVVITSPAEGVITERTANAGLVVMDGAPLFTISSTSPVWIIADVHERDVSRVRVGTAATVTTEGEPPISGKVAYISPDLRADTRTAQVRVEAPNPGGRMRFGMFVNVELSSSTGAGGAMVPASALQQVAGRTFLYLQDAARRGAFVEREVTAGAHANGSVEILRGVKPGDIVVSEGSFFVRAERERLGLRPGGGAGARGVTGSRPAVTARTVRVAVTGTGFVPASVEAQAGTRLKLAFVRETDETCAREVVVPARGIRRPLPLNQTIIVDLGTVARETVFACGMDMLKGAVIVK